MEQRRMASATERAVRRLDAALNTLEFALQQRLSLSLDAPGLAAEVEMLTADRARLAESLDQSEARSNRLETANRDAARRVDKALETVRAVLAADDGNP
jgi:hypothetical protein